MIRAKEVAEKAGFSRSTVQRALSGSPNIAPETKERILRIAQKMGYKPNKTARALVMRQQKLKYGVIFTSTGNPFYQEELKGIKRAKEELKEYGIELEVVFMNTIDADEQVRIINRMVQEGAKGIAFIALDSEQVREAVNDGIAQGTQFLTITSDLEATGRFCYVGWDQYQGGRVAGGLMQWLVAPGDKVAIILGSKQYRAHRKRLEGFIQRFSENRNRDDIVAVLENQDDSKVSERLVINLFSDGQDIKGVFLVGAGVEGACKGLKDLGLDQSVRIICFDLLETHITLCRGGVIDIIIDQEPFEQGYRAIKILNNFIIYNEIPAEKVLSKINIHTKDNLES